MKHLIRRNAILVMFLLAGTAFAQQTERDRGIDLYREGKFADAISVLEKSVAADESDRAAWLYLAGAYIHTDEKSKAMKAFDKSRVRPTAPQPKYDKSVKVTYKPHPTYTDQARKRMSSGTVRIAVEFRADGTIGFAFPLQTLVDPELVQQSVNAAKGIRFEPAMKNGEVVTVINLVEYGFWIG